MHTRNSLSTGTHRNSDIIHAIQNSLREMCEQMGFIDMEDIQFLYRDPDEWSYGFWGDMISVYNKVSAYFEEYSLEKSNIIPIKRESLETRHRYESVLLRSGKAIVQGIITSFHDRATRMKEGIWPKTFEDIDWLEGIEQMAEAMESAMGRDESIDWRDFRNLMEVIHEELSMLEQKEIQAKSIQAQTHLVRNRSNTVLAPRDIDIPKIAQDSLWEDTLPGWHNTEQAWMDTTSESEYFAPRNERLESIRNLIRAGASPEELRKLKGIVHASGMINADIRKAANEVLGTNQKPGINTLNLDDVEIQKAIEKVVTKEIHGKGAQNRESISELGLTIIGNMHDYYQERAANDDAILSQVSLIDEISMSEEHEIIECRVGGYKVFDIVGCTPIIQQGKKYLKVKIESITQAGQRESQHMIVSEQGFIAGESCRVFSVGKGPNGTDLLHRINVYSIRRSGRFREDVSELKKERDVIPEGSKGMKKWLDKASQIASQGTTIYQNTKQKISSWFRK